MPRYEYRCPSCHTEFEVEHGMREKVEPTCPECGTKAERVFLPSGMVLKGSGFYNTDHPSDKTPREAVGASEPCEKARSGAEECKSCPAAAAAAN